MAITSGLPRPARTSGKMPVSASAPASASGKAPARDVSPKSPSNAGKASSRPKLTSVAPAPSTTGELEHSSPPQGSTESTASDNLATLGESASGSTQITALGDVPVPEGYAVHHHQDPPATVLHPENEVKGSLDGEGAGKGPSDPAPFDDLPQDRRPPLLQNLAPNFPFDDNVDRYQMKRRSWRGAWFPYAQSLIRLIGKLIVDERDRENPSPGYIRIYEYYIASIEEDINDVMKQNPSIQVATYPIQTGPRTTHSYLTYSERLLRVHQTALENLFGTGSVEIQQLVGIPSTVFGQNYPGDSFREILHYRLQDAPPEGFVATVMTRTIWLQACFWATVTLSALVLLDACIGWLGYRGLLSLLGGLSQYLAKIVSLPNVVRYLTALICGSPLPDLGDVTLPSKFKVSGTMRVYGIGKPN